MANAMPQAIGIQAAQPGRQVISLSGDGGFTMLMGDLITLTQQKLPVKVVIFNNGVLGFVALEMKTAGFVETGVELENPDFAAMARAMGIHAQRVDDPGELPSAVDAMLAHPGPALLDVVTAKHELSMPPTIGAEQIKGFSLWVLRAVMSGRGDEVIDLAKPAFCLADRMAWLRSNGGWQPQSWRDLFEGWLRSWSAVPRSNSQGGSNVLGR